MSPERMKYILEHDPEKTNLILKQRYIYLEDTTDDDIKKAKEGKLDLVSAIKEQIESDVENETNNLLHLYETCSTEERAIADYLLVQICGYTLHTIINEIARGFED